MKQSQSLELLHRLGAGEKIAAICQSAGLSRDEFDHWWQAECQRRLPAGEGRMAAGVRCGTRIDRDRWGVPYIYAGDDEDLFFSLGFAVGQDRLFQIDYVRRKATGRLAEVMGRDALVSDITYRTLGLAQIAEAEWNALPDESHRLLQAYTDGINAWIAAMGQSLPIEFDLLDYRPEPWRPQDSLAIAGEFRWYLTGRLPVVAIPELLKRHLGDGPLYYATLLGEADEESILRPGDYTRSLATWQTEPAGDGGINSPGSNNWALAGTRTTTGKALLAGDPHLIYSALPIWFEVRLKGGSFDVAGSTLAGLPGVMIGRAPRVAWTFTNNICSQRDVYQERVRRGTPESFQFDGRWEPAIERHETIHVRGEEPVHRTVRSSRNGPIVDELLPPAAQHTGPIALRWVGQQPCGWLTALLNMNRAASVTEFCEATRPWLCPTWNVVCADVEGHIGLQTTGRIPRRNLRERGCRPGWEPRHQWAGLLAFEEMPRLIDPARGYLVTANNRLAPDDYPQPLNCTATSGHRARRIRQQIEARGKLSVEDCQQMQHDVISLRAAECVPLLVSILRDMDDPGLQQAVKMLRQWDHQATPESVPCSIFNVFFVYWCREVAAERLTDGDSAAGSHDVAVLAADRLNGLASRLLAGDLLGWFHRRQRVDVVVAAMRAALHDLTARLGDDMQTWLWGRLHTLRQPHYLSGRGDLGTLLDQSGLPIAGDGTTVCNATPNAQWQAYLGVSNRTVVDLGDPKLGMWVIDAASASALPGSPHYADQLEPWNRGEYRFLSLDTDSSLREREHNQ